MKKKDILKILMLVFLLLISKLYVINPINEKKQLLETKKIQITQNIDEIENYRKNIESINKDKKREKIFSGSDDVLEIQNNVGKIVKIQSIENIVEINEQGIEKSNISLKFVGTYDDIFKVMDMFTSRGISDYIKSISLSKVSSYTSNPIPDIPELSNTDNSSVKFECTLKISKN